MRRREFITLLGGAAAWPLAARAQQAERVRKVGVLINSTATPEQRANLAAFQQTLQQLGWTVGRNVQMDIRLAEGDPRRNSQTRERVGRTGSGRHCCGRRCRDAAVTAGECHHTDRVQQCCRPGRRRLRQEHGAAGRQCHRLHSIRIQLEREMAVTLKEIEPRLTRVAVLRDATVASGIGQFAVIQSVASSLGVGDERHRRARPRRDRGPTSRIGARRPWRPDSARQRVGSRSPRTRSSRWRPGTSCRRSIYGREFVTPAA